MASWDEVKSRISWAGRAAVVKTRTMAKIATVSGKISDARKSVDESCLALGRMLVDTEYAGLSAEEIEELIRKAEESGEETQLLKAVMLVKKSEETLDELIEEKSLLKCITPCRVCGREITSGEEFCSVCGARVVPEDEPEDDPYEEDEEDDADEPEDDAGTEDDGDIEEEAEDEDSDEDNDTDSELPHPVEIEVNENDEAAEEVVKDLADDMAEDVKRYMEDDGDQDNKE